MKWLVWNIRGIHQKDSITHLKSILRMHDISILILLEPKANHSEIPRFAFNTGFTAWVHGADSNTHVWILWKGSWHIQTLFIHPQAITVEITIANNQKIVASFVYANCLKRIRRELWEHLDLVSATIRQRQLAWILAGDFNVVTDIAEKKGGIQIDMGAIQEFQDTIMRNELIDAGFIGDVYTWCNNRRGQQRIWERLDRALFNLGCQSEFPDISVHHLPRVSSDHSPLLIRFEGDGPRISSGFIFQRMWTDHPDFLQLVATDWAKPMRV